MNHQHCGTCRFHLHETGTRGKCHRYPHPAETRNSHWCGEYAPVADTSSQFNPPPPKTKRQDGPIDAP